ncbi:MULTISPECIES: ABC transporter ATP-binding protein [unclassified Schlesneria]|uniref:ABC transporter ATP-binding protein n=1 Tax=Schlesneria TaxID=656899 RepID=UPI00359F445E
MSNSTNGSATRPVIEVDDVVHSYKGRRALDHVSFKVMPQSLHGFVGPNGAGKTTSLKIICTLLRPQFGIVKVFGHDVVDEQKLVRRKIGFMPDHFSTYRQMTVYEYLDFFAAAYGLPFAQRTQVIDEVLALTDMEKRKNDLISGLSRGMQQRTSLARVLVNDPELLLLDEPASGLDPRARIELMEILKALRSMGKTIFISSHILPELAELCDSVTIIDKGKVMYSGSMSGLQTSSNEYPTWRVTLDSEVEGIAEQILGLPGIISVDQVEGRPDYRVAYDWTVTDRNSLLRGILDLGAPITAFTEDKRHLNDAFMDLTTKGVK